MITFNAEFNSHVFSSFRVALIRMLGVATRRKVSPKYCFQPATLVEFKPGKTVKRSNNTQEVVKGLQRGHYCQIDASHDPITILKLVKHELGHVVLTSANPRLSTTTQHNLIAQNIGV